LTDPISPCSVQVHKWALVVTMSVQMIEDALCRALDGDYSSSLSQLSQVDADPDTQKLVGLVENTIGQMKKSAEYKDMLRGVDEFIAHYPHPLAIYGADGTCLMLNDHYCSLFRNSCDTLMKKSLHDFDITILDGDGLFASHETKKNSETDLQVAWDDGSKNYLKLYQVPVSDGAGGISVVYHIFMDQTTIIGEREDLHRLQKRADAFLQQNPQGITALAADKHRLDLNEEYQRIWRGGYDDLMAKKLYDFDITIVGGDDFYASYETKQKAVTDMEIGWEKHPFSMTRVRSTSTTTSTRTSHNSMRSWRRSRNCRSVRMPFSSRIRRVSRCLPPTSTVST
jgi:methyl-accepting chemotaxis protein